VKRLGILFLVFGTTALWGQTPKPSQTLPSVPEILDKMMARNEWQERSLVEYRVRRKFYAVNKRFNAESTMVVDTVFRRPEGLQSTVMSHEGSKFIRSRLFDKFLEAETKAKKEKQQADIVPANYNFTMIGLEDCEGRSCYRMKIIPKRPDKYTLNGEVWVDAEDYGIIRLKGTSAKKVSFWASHTEIDRRYKKIDGMWLLDRMDSSSDIKLAGRSELSIEYAYEAVMTNLTADRR
jgi:hypothetical protein